jgi:hypothetical protein
MGNTESIIEKECKNMTSEEVWKVIRDVCREKWLPRFYKEKEFPGTRDLYKKRLLALFRIYLKKSRGLTYKDVEIRLRKEHNELFETTRTPTITPFGLMYAADTKTFCTPVCLVAYPLTKEQKKFGVVVDCNGNQIKDGHEIRVTTDGTMDDMDNHLFFDPKQNLIELEHAGTIDVFDQKKCDEWIKKNNL